MLQIALKLRLWSWAANGEHATEPEPRGDLFVHFGEIR